MGNKKGITLEEALKMLEAANSIIQSQQKEISDRQLKIDAQSSVIHSKELQLKQQEAEIKQNQIELEKRNLEILQLQEKLATQLRYRFCAYSEKADKQPSLFDFEDEAYIPSEEEIEATVAGECPYNEQTVKSYKRHKCGRKKLSEDLPRREIIWIFRKKRNTVHVEQNL